MAWHGDLEIFKLIVDKVPLKAFIEKSKEHLDNTLGKFILTFKIPLDAYFLITNWGTLLTSTQQYWFVPSFGPI